MSEEDATPAEQTPAAPEPALGPLNEPDQAPDPDSPTPQPDVPAPEEEVEEVDE